METVNCQIRLRDGRHLAYAEYGNPQGKPIFFFHDIPGSRFFRPDSPVTDSSGARIIAIDRPGFGGSDAKPGRKIVDWPNDVLQLADALNIERFAVMGYSAGGPYAAVCAAKIPERLTAAGLIGSLSPMDNPHLVRGMQGAGNLFFSLDRHFPPLARLGCRLVYLSWKHNPDLYLKSQTESLARSEKAQIASPAMKAMLQADMLEAVRAGTEGICWDLTLLARPWGFNLHTIIAQVFLWHGDRDQKAPVAMGQRLATAIPHCKATFFPGESHWAIHTHWSEILAALTQTDMQSRTEALPLRVATEIPEDKPEIRETAISESTNMPQHTDQGLKPAAETAKPDTTAEADQVLKPAAEIVEPLATQTTTSHTANIPEASCEASPKPQPEEVVTKPSEDGDAIVANPVDSTAQKRPSRAETKPVAQKAARRRNTAAAKNPAGKSAEQTAKANSRKPAKPRSTIPADASTGASPQTELSVEKAKPGTRKPAKNRTVVAAEAPPSVPELETAPETKPAAREAGGPKIAVIEAMREGRFEGAQPAHKPAEPTPKKSLSSLST